MTTMGNYCNLSEAVKYLCIQLTQDENYGPLEWDMFWEFKLRKYFSFWALIQKLLILWCNTKVSMLCQFGVNLVLSRGWPLFTKLKYFGLSTIAIGFGLDAYTSMMYLATQVSGHMWSRIPNRWYPPVWSHTSYVESIFITWNIKAIWILGLCPAFPVWIDLFVCCPFFLCGSAQSFSVCLLVSVAKVLRVFYNGTSLLDTQVLAFDFVNKTDALVLLPTWVFFDCYPTFIAEEYQFLF